MTTIYLLCGPANEDVLCWYATAAQAEAARLKANQDDVGLSAYEAYISGSDTSLMMPIGNDYRRLTWDEYAAYKGDYFVRPVDQGA